MAIDASAFDGNLVDTDDTAQKVADKVDALPEHYKGGWFAGVEASIGELYIRNGLFWISRNNSNLTEPGFEEDANWSLVTSRAHWRGVHVLGDRYLSGQFAVEDGIVYLATAGYRNHTVG